MASADEAVSLLQVGAAKKHNRAEVDSSVMMDLADPPYSDEELKKLLAPHQIKEYSSGIPAGCQPKLIASHKKCKVINHSVGSVPRVNPGDTSSGGASGNYLGVEGEMGWTNKGNPKGYRVDRKFQATGIVGAWSRINRGDCCTTIFVLHEIGGGQKWQAMCEAASNTAGDACTEMVDAPGYYIFDAATESCGIPELSVEKNPGKCTIRSAQVVEGCQPKLVKENYECSAMGPQEMGTWGAYGPYSHQGRVNLGTATSPDQCVAKWASNPNCCGLRLDWDWKKQSCACADFGPMWNWWCQDDRMSPNDRKHGNFMDVHSNVYDISHCVNPRLHDCPGDPAAYRGDPCKTLLTASLESLEYSNLGGQGPDTGLDGMLFTDVASVNGESIDLKIVAPGFKSVNPENNRLSNGIGTLNIRCGTSAEVSYRLINKEGGPVMVDGLAITFLDMDEGKNGKSRTTVTTCGTDILHAGSELTTSEEEGVTTDEKPTMCFSASSAKHGSAANNPDSLDGITEDQKSRAATFMFAAGSEFNVTIAVSKGPKGRNIAFALSPVNGCD